MARPSLSDGTTTVEFVKLSGQLQPFAQSVMDITRPGVDGVAFRLEGKRSEARPFEALRDVSATYGEARDLKQSVANFKGKLVTMVDEYGESIVSVFVKDVELTMDKAIGKGTGGIVATPVRLLGWKIMLQATALPA